MDHPISQASVGTAVSRAAARVPAAASAGRTASLFGGYRRRADLVGQSLTWLCGGALAFNLLLVIAILLLLAYNGLGYFWQRDLVQIDVQDGAKVLGEIWEVEKVPAAPGADPSTAIDRLRVKTGNRDITGLDFAWIDRADVAAMSRPGRRCSWSASSGAISTAC